MDFVESFLGSLHFSVEFFADLFFFLSAAFVGVASLIMFFHWKKYGMGGPVLALAEVVYLSGAAVLITIAFFSIN